MRPDDPAYHGQSLWVTIDCLGEPSDGSAESTRYDKLCAWVGDRRFRVAEHGHMGDSDLIVNDRDFTQDEFLKWIKVWLQAKGLAVTALIAAP